MHDELVVRPGDGTTFRLGGIAARVLVDAAHTTGTLAIVEAPIAPKTLAGPLHTHHKEDTLWYVLDGEFGGQIGERLVHEGPGTVIFAPKGLPHTYWNPGESAARYLEMAWPAGLEGYLEQLGQLVGNPDEDVLSEVGKLSDAFGIEMHWESIATLMEQHGVSIEV